MSFLAPVKLFKKYLDVCYSFHACKFNDKLVFTLTICFWSSDGMYPIFEPGQKIFSNNNSNDWENLNRDLWVGINFIEEKQWYCSLLIKHTGVLNASWAEGRMWAISICSCPCLLSLVCTHLWNYIVCNLIKLGLKHHWIDLDQTCLHNKNDETIKLGQILGKPFIAD